MTAVLAVEGVEHGQQLASDAHELAGKEERVVAVDEHLPAPELFDVPVPAYDGERELTRVGLHAFLPAGDELGTRTADVAAVHDALDRVQARSVGAVGDEYVVQHVL